LIAWIFIWPEGLYTSSSLCITTYIYVHTYVQFQGDCSWQDTASSHATRTGSAVLRTAGTLSQDQKCSDQGVGGYRRLRRAGPESACILPAGIHPGRTTITRRFLISRVVSLHCYLFGGTSVYIPELLFTYDINKN
jgi:hypothetical protein